MLTNALLTPRVLEPVRSCGTEDRPVERALAPRDEIYDYIVFRATDIQDLTVSEPPKEREPNKPPVDPAIVSVGDVTERLTSHGVGSEGGS